MTFTDDNAQLRKSIYVLLIVIATGMAAGRILGVERVYEPTLYKADENDTFRRGTWPTTRPPALPTFSSNDRARWATVRSLIDHGTFVIGERTYHHPPDERGRTYRDRSTWQDEDWEPGWDTVDKVLHPETNEFYSTKPALLPVLVAGLYWLMQLLTGWTLANNVWEVVKTTLLLINVVPFALYLWFLSCLVERFGRSDWSKLFGMAAACFATVVTPFLITFNNHTVATFSVLFALYPALLILTGDDDPESPPWYLFAVAGLFAGFAACNELPALAFTAGLLLILALRSPAKTLLFFVPLAAVPIAAFLLTNMAATGDLRPIYFKFGTVWYKFEGSHWNHPPDSLRGIDYAGGHESRAAYAFHLLVGHHGLFSLTPLWLLSFAGMIFGSLFRKNGDEKNRLPWYFFAASLLLSLIVLGFYLIRSDNYGGWTSGLRWLMWLSPVWLLCLLPMLDRLAESRLGRGFAYVLLLLSVLSVSFPAWNPWRHPWIYRWMEVNGWIPYGS